MDYEAFKKLGLSLDLSRGKPSPDVLDLSNELLGALDTYIAEDGTDIRNYGIPTGLPECKRLLADLLGLKQESIIAGGNSSLNQMYNVMSMMYLFGPPGFDPWSKQENIKFICPVPGYDRHFTVAEDFKMDLMTVPMTDSGPDMDEVERICGSDPAVKGIWNIPQYSNPTGILYSDETVRRMAEMETAAPDFRVFWDNAYAVHHVWQEHHIADIMSLAEAAGHPERVYYFFSTSKVTFPGAGIALVASGPENIKQLTDHITRQTIGYDKVSQMRFVKMFDGDAANIRRHMHDISQLIRPKFELVLSKLDDEFSGTDLVRRFEPRGGYFISIDVPDGCAKRVVSLAKEAGAVLTPAGATFPYGIDPRDSNIRIAPTYPNLDELEQTMDLLCVCIKKAASEKNL